MIPESHEFFRDLMAGGQSVYTAKQARFIQKAEKFAKLHVEAALKAAATKAEVVQDWSGNTGSEYVDYIVRKDSILNAYPLDNIK